MRRWYSIPSVVWFGQVPDPINKTYFLKFLIREIRVYSRISVWKPRFFPRQAIPKILFVSDSRFTGDTPYRNWFDLKKFLIRRKRPIFKIRYSRNSQISYEILTFFPTQSIPKILVASDSRCAGNTPYRVLFDLDKSLIRWKRPVLKFVIREIRKFCVWSTNFFRTQAIPKNLVVSDSGFTGNTPYRNWFGLNNFLIISKRPIFKIIFWK